MTSKSYLRTYEIRRWDGTVLGTVRAFSVATAIAQLPVHLVDAYAIDKGPRGPQEAAERPKMSRPR